jgi:integrase
MVLSDVSLSQKNLEELSSRVEISSADDLLSRASSIIEAGTPDTTKRAYRSDLAYWMHWARESLGMQEFRLPLAPEHVVRFIVDHVEGPPAHVDEALIALGVKAQTGPHKMTTITRRVATLSFAHRVRNLENPCRHPSVTVLMSKARRAAVRQGARPRQKAAAMRSVLEAMLATCERGNLIDIRDRALLLFAWASGGRRRSEVASATMEDLTSSGSNFIFHLRISKTDQDGEGRNLPVKGKAAEALRVWIAASGVKSGAIFRGVSRHGAVADHGIDDRTVARVIQKRAKMAGLDPDQYGGHSIRSGFVTEGGLRGRSLFEVMELTGHKSVRIAMGYYRSGSVLSNPAADMIE